MRGRSAIDCQNFMVKRGMFFRVFELKSPLVVKTPRAEFADREAEAGQ